MNQQARTRVSSARTALLLEHPFFGVLALRLKLVEDTMRPTAWTDGESMGYNPDFVNSLTHDELMGVVAHEVMHCAAGHPWRRDAREPRRWNYAADYAINFVLAEAGLKLPEGCLREAQYDGKSAEWIFARLPEQLPPTKGRRGGNGEPMPGAGAEDVSDAPRQSATADAQTDAASAGGDDEGIAPTESDWQQAVQQSAQAAKMRGKLPASLDRFAAAAAQPRVDWRSVLRRFVQSAAKADYSWARPNARFMARGLYLPSLKSEALGPIAIAVDTSGSIDAVTLSAFAAEMNAIVSEVRPERVHVIYCDAKVHRIDAFEADEPIEIKPVGGGGTDFCPALDAADQLDDDPCCLIYLTDQYGQYRDQPPSMPVLWASTCPQAAPYGEVVSLAHV